MITTLVYFCPLFLLLSLSYCLLKVFDVLNFLDFWFCFTLESDRELVETSRIFFRLFHSHLLLLNKLVVGNLVHVWATASLRVTFGWAKWIFFFAWACLFLACTSKIASAFGSGATRIGFWWFNNRYWFQFFKTNIFQFIRTSILLIHKLTNFKCVIQNTILTY